MKIGLIVGSLRKDSWHKKVAEVVKGIFPSEYEVSFVDVANLPMYNEDLDGANEIPEYRKIRDEIRGYDGILFFTPEYNRSYSPVIKNVIDVVSRDPKGNPWAKKPAGVITASTGAFGGMAANHALRQTFVFLDIVPMQQPEVYLGGVDKLFDANGKMENSCNVFLMKVVDAFIRHVEFNKR